MEQSTALIKQNGSYGLAPLMEMPDTLRKLEEFTKKLNAVPDQDWLKKTPDGQAEYIPISIIETELRQDFAGLVQFILKSTREVFNEKEIVATIRVFHPVILQWLDYDGIASVPIMQDKGAKVIDFASTKKANALKLVNPNCFAEALKNAAKKIGKKYGADINRKIEDTYDDVYTKELDAREAIDFIGKVMDNCKTPEDLVAIWNQHPDLQTNGHFKKHFSAAKARIKLKTA